jgi:hypothetical protein
MPRKLSSRRRLPRRAETLPVRFTSDPITQPRLRDPRRDRDYLPSTRSRVLDPDRGPVLQDDSDDELYYRPIRVDYQQTHGDDYEPVLPPSSDESDYIYQRLNRRGHDHSKHERYHARGGYQDSDSGSDGYIEAYDFNLSRENRSPLIPDSSVDLKTVVYQQQPIMLEAQEPTSGSKPAKVLHIIRSQYTGDGSTGGLQSARLTAIQEGLLNFEKGILPLFRWMCVKPFYQWRETCD